VKAILCTRYGPPDVLQLKEVETPSPQGNQVLLKVRASSINAADYRLMRANPFLVRLSGGLLRPKDPRTGSDVAGVVVAVGEEATQFRVGDEVFGCAAGPWAEYALAKEANLAKKPANRSFDEAAAVPVGALTALQGLRDAAKIQSGQEVLIQGASGSVGSFAVQIAKAYEAMVTAVCSTRNVDMARSIGADRVIDYTQEDFTRRPERYDLIFAVNGYHPLAAYERALKPQGTYVCAGGDLPQIFEGLLLASRRSKEGGKTMGMMGIAKVVQADLVYLGQLLESGKIVSWIDRRYPLDQVPEAMRYVEEEHSQGKVVITVASDPGTGDTGQ
jgi:NADPH:quinone reductase-like Zn-dependent oxidoreductase